MKPLNKTFVTGILYLVFLRGIQGYDGLRHRRHLFSAILRECLEYISKPCVECVTFPPGGPDLLFLLSVVKPRMPTYRSLAPSAPRRLPNQSAKSPCRFAPCVGATTWQVSLVFWVFFSLVSSWAFFNPSWVWSEPKNTESMTNVVPPSQRKHWEFDSTS